MPSPAVVTVGTLLTLDVLRDAEVIGGSEALQREVRMVVVGGHIRQVGDLPEGTLVVFDRSQLAIEDYSADVVLRRGVVARIAGVVAEAPPRGLPSATQRLAEKFGITLILLPKVHAAAIAARLDPFARVPTVATAATLRAAVQRLSQVPGQPAELLSTMSSALACPVALTDAAGRMVHGDRAAVSQSILLLLADTERLRSRAPQVITDRGGQVSVLAPAVANSTGAANLWFVVRLPGPSSAMVEVVTAIVGVAAIAFAAYLSATALTSEREGRRRALLLTEIMEQGDEPVQRTVERATALGWRLYGWHVAVQISIRHSPAGPLPGGVGVALEEALVQFGITAGLVDRPDGWAFWTSYDASPTQALMSTVVSAVGRALVAVERNAAGLSLCAGVGGAHEGTAGIGLSLQEAHDAGLLARSREIAGAVEQMDPLSIRRLLVGWYSYGPLQEIATALVQPLLVADPAGELLRTLRCYLDHQCSPTTTAAVLGVHRNTVMYRLTRIRELLSADLDRPDERLAVHLAVHAAATLRAGRS